MTKVRDFIGPYRLARLIRAGQTCQVWEVVKDATGERFALKLLRLELQKDKSEAGYLKHEYEVAKDMNHPHVIRIYEYSTQYQTPFLVLELYSALNLKIVLREGLDQIAWITEKIIDQSSNALHYLHQKGWIHCDLKPDNLLVNDEGNVKLIDFTIAQRPKKSLLSFFGVKTAVRGTRSYMSPEQIRGESLDPRSDIYSFGCLLFELLTGRAPFTGATPNELLSKHLKASIPAVVVYNPNVTKECSDLLRRMMAKKKDARPKTMWDVLQEFNKIHIFSKKPQPPKKKLSELDIGPVTDVDALKNLPQQRPEG